VEWDKGEGTLEVANGSKKAVGRVGDRGSYVLMSFCRDSNHFDGTENATRRSHFAILIRFPFFIHDACYCCVRSTREDVSICVITFDGWVWKEREKLERVP